MADKDPYKGISVMPQIVEPDNNMIIIILQLDMVNVYGKYIYLKAL